MKQEASTNTAIFLYLLTLIVAVIGWYNITVIQVSFICLFLFSIALNFFIE